MQNSSFVRYRLGAAGNLHGFASKEREKEHEKRTADYIAQIVLGERLRDLDADANDDEVDKQPLQKSSFSIQNSAF